MKRPTLQTTIYMCYRLVGAAIDARQVTVSERLVDWHQVVGWYGFAQPCILLYMLIGFSQQKQNLAHQGDGENTFPRGEGGPAQAGSDEERRQVRKQKQPNRCT